MKILMRTILVSALTFVAAGCSSPESQLEGKWVGKTGSFVFSKDKTGVVSPPAHRTDLPQNVRYTWSIEGSDRVRMDMGPPVEKTIYGKLEGKDAMIVEDDRFIKQ